MHKKRKFYLFMCLTDFLMRNDYGEARNCGNVQLVTTSKMIARRQRGKQNIRKHNCSREKSIVIFHHFIRNLKSVIKHQQILFTTACSFSCQFIFRAWKR